MSNNDDDFGGFEVKISQLLVQNQSFKYFERLILKV